MNLKPLEQSVVDELKAKNPELFCLCDGDVPLIVFKKPGKAEHKRFRKETEEGIKGADIGLMTSCIIAPDVAVVEEAMEEDYFMNLLIKSAFINEISKPYQNLKVK